MSRPAPSAPAKASPGPPPSRGAASDLVGARLPKWSPYVSAVAGWGIALALKLLLGWTGWYTTFFSGAVLFIIIYTAWSFKIEGRRRAKDRFALSWPQYHNGKALGPSPFLNEMPTLAEQVNQAIAAPPLEDALSDAELYGDDGDE